MSLTAKRMNKEDTFGSCLRLSIDFTTYYNPRKLIKSVAYKSAVECS